MDLKSPNITKITSDNICEFPRVIHAAVAGCFLCTKGNVNLRMNDRLYQLSAGTLFIYIPFCHVYVETYSNDIEGIISSASEEFVMSALRRISRGENLLFISQNPMVRLSEENLERIYRIMEVFHMAGSGNGVFSKLTLDALGAALCYEIISAYISVNPMPADNKNRHDEIYFQFRRELYEKCRQYRDVAYYARRQNLTPRYFSNIINSVSGRSALSWIISAVLEEVKELMTDTCMSFKEIAFKMNFSSQSSFARYFRQYTGKSPGEYRAELLRK